MAALIIKVTKDGSSRQYMFSKLGPIVIGADEKSDVRIDDLEVEAKVLEVKLSAGNIFVKELGHRDQILLENVILPFREEVPYPVGKTISFAQNRYQIQILKGAEAAEPPPFFTEDYKKVLEDLKRKIKEKEEVLISAEKSLEKRRASIDNMDSFIRTKLTERNKREVEVDFLNQKITEINLELAKKHEDLSEGENNLRLLQDHVDRLRSEDRALAENILKAETTLGNLKGIIERTQADVRSQRDILVQLELQEKQQISRLEDLRFEEQQLKDQSQNESAKIRSLLEESDRALREKQQLETKIERLKLVLTEAERNLQGLTAKAEDQEKQRLHEQAKLQDLSFEIERYDQQLAKLKQALLLEQEKERQLKKLNEEYRIELIKVEDRLAAKRNQSHQLDYQNQDALKKLNQLKNDIEATSNHLQDLVMEEKSQDLKMLSLRKEQELFQKKLGDDRKHWLEHFEAQRFKDQDELKHLSEGIEKTRFELAELEHQLEEAQKKHSQYIAGNRALAQEKSELELKIEGLMQRKHDIEKSTQSSLEHNSSLSLEKGRLESEIALLRLKLLDCEGQIRNRETEAMVELENLRREERNRLASERELMLSEVAAERQKGEIHLDSMFKDQEARLHLLRMEKLQESEQVLKEAQAEAAIIRHRAQESEAQLIAEATKRLSDVTQEAYERENKANQRMSEAQVYFQQREREAEILVTSAKRRAEELARQAESEIQRELTQSKEAIKGFKLMRMNKAKAHVRSVEQVQFQKLKKTETVTLKSLENFRRRELKKIAKLKVEEAALQNTQREQYQKQMRAANETLQRELREQKKRLEQELADSKKNFLEQLSSTKLRQQQAMEEELRKQKFEFERAKSERVENASHAVIHTLISKLGPLSVNSDELKSEISHALEVTLNGHSIDKQKQAEEILDYNPTKKKSILPVLQKYALRYGLPATLTIVFAVDVSNLRTELFSAATTLLKQQKSASDEYVKNQRQEWKEKYTFNPVTSVGYKDTYTDNVLYTTGFYEIMESEAFQNEWLLAVNNFIVQNLELSEELAISFISAEGTMVKEMWQVRQEINPMFLEAGVAKLKELEKTHMGWLPQKFADEAMLKKFVQFRKSYFDEYYSKHPIAQPTRELATQDEINL